MKTELILYKSNILKNWNFNGSNTKIANDGVTIINYWETNGLWTISSGQAICINSDGSTLEQSGLTLNTNYKLTINVQSLTDYIIVSVGSNSHLITTSGVTSISLNSGSGDSISILCSNGFDATINWVSITEDPNVCYLDQVNDLSIPITFAIADIKDLSKRNGSSTRTITIPGTPNNNRIFNEIFEISGDCSFNPNKKVKAILIYDGEEQMNGYLQIKNINRNQTGFNSYDLVSYDVVIIAGVTNIFADMGTTLLADLGYSEYTHAYTAINQELSWNDGIYKNGVYTPNWINGLSKSVDSVQVSSDGRVKLTFTLAHGFNIDDQIYVNFSDPSALEYNGDHKIFSIVSSTEIILFFPYIAGTGTLTGANFAFTHKPTGDGYVYPMIYYGSHIDNTNMDGINYNVTDFVPSIYLRTYLNKIQDRFGYTFVSDKFDSDEFKRLIMVPSVKALKPSNEQLNHRAFQASKTTTYSESYNLKYLNPTAFYKVDSGTPNIQTGLSTLDVIFDDDSTLPNFDNQLTYNTTTGRWTPTETCVYSLTTTIAFTQTYTIPSGITSYATPVDYFRIIVNFYNYTTGTVVSNRIIDIPFYNSSGNTFNYTVPSGDFTMNAGQEYGVRLQYGSPNLVGLYPTFSSPWPQINVNWSFSSQTFFNEPKDSPLVDGNIVDITSSVPKMTCNDFLITLFRMFNLYIEPDKDNDKILYVLPRPEYYDYGVTEDWTDLLDKDSAILQQPMAELNAKEYQYILKADKASLNEKHLTNAGYGYGDKIVKVDNDFLTSTIKTEVSVSSGVLLEYPTTSKRVITGIYADSNGTKTRMDGNPRILYFGLASSYPNKWNHNSILSGQSITGKFIFPYAGHLDKVRGPQLDFQFGYPDENEFTTNQWTSANLYNLYYKDMIDELTSRNNKLVTVYLYLKNSDISKLSFRSQYIIDGHYLRLNKIYDFIPGSSNPTKCEFTKIESGFKFTPSYMRTNLVGPGFGQDYLDGDKLPTNTISIAGSDANPTIFDNGFRNSINLSESNRIIINGEGNSIGSNTTNLSLINTDNTFVYGGLSNVTLIGVTGGTISESNATYIGSESTYITSNTIVLDGDVVLNGYTFSGTFSGLNNLEQTLAIGNTTGTYSIVGLNGELDFNLFGSSVTLNSGDWLNTPSILLDPSSDTAQLRSSNAGGSIIQAQTGSINLNTNGSSVAINSIISLNGDVRIPGGSDFYTSTTTFDVTSDANTSFGNTIAITGSMYNLISGELHDLDSTSHNTISGNQNTIYGSHGNIIGGQFNNIFGTVSFSDSNLIIGESNQVINCRASVVSGENNIISYSTHNNISGYANIIGSSLTASVSSIIGGSSNELYGNRSIVYGNTNLVYTNNSIVGSYGNTVRGTANAVFCVNGDINAEQSMICGFGHFVTGTSSQPTLDTSLSGYINQLYGVQQSVVSGFGNIIHQCNQSLIIGGGNYVRPTSPNFMSGNIVAGMYNTHSVVGNSNIIAGNSNVSSSFRSLIVGEFNSNTGIPALNSIICGQGNTNTASHNILSGLNNTLSGNRSAIIGGQSITGTLDDTVYVPSLRLEGTTSALVVSRLTTVQKTALTAVNGMIVYDTTLNKFQGYENGSWINLI